jgi:hypothetical protein
MNVTLETIMARVRVKRHQSSDRWDKAENSH